MKCPRCNCTSDSTYICMYCEYSSKNPLLYVRYVLFNNAVEWIKHRIPLILLSVIYYEAYVFCMFQDFSENPSFATVHDAILFICFIVAMVLTAMFGILGLILSLSENSFRPFRDMFNMVLGTYKEEDY